MTSYFHFYGPSGHVVTMRLCCVKDAYNILRANKGKMYRFKSSRTQYREHTLKDSTPSIH